MMKFEHDASQVQNNVDETIENEPNGINKQRRDRNVRIRNKKTQNHKRIEYRVVGTIVKQQNANKQGKQQNYRSE